MTPGAAKPYIQLPPDVGIVALAVRREVHILSVLAILKVVIILLASLLKLQQHRTICLVISLLHVVTFGSYFRPFMRIEER